MNSTNKDKYDEGPKSFGLSARTSWFDTRDKSLPGPGAYKTVRINKTNPPEWVLGTSTERDTFLDKFHFEYPPPDYYEPKFQTTRPQLPNYSIPQADHSYLDKNRDQHNELLYNPNYVVGKQTAPKFSLGYFNETDYSKPTPAPNEYNVQTQRSFFNKTQNAFSVSKRPPPYGEYAKFPGATKYHIQNYKRPTVQYSIGKSQRPELIIGKDSPGVFYEIRGRMTDTNKVKTFAKPYFPSQQNSAKKDRKKDDFPSPDKYTPLFQKSKRSIITTYGNRVPIENTSVLNFPSPQKYHTQTDFYKRKSFSFTKDVRQRSFINGTPGPGTHEVPAKLGTKSGIMGKKLKEETKFQTPAADQYEPKDSFTKQSPPRTISFYSNRVDFSKSLTGQKIGPGSYIVEKQTRAELGKISKSLKFPKQSNKNPGPGSYNIPSGIGKLPQYYTGSKKITREGFTTFTLQRWQKQKQKKQKLQESQRKKQQEENEKKSYGN